ncbi:MAG: ABC transporter permease [Paludibacteraceae bacterium]|jgi:phospholipid/cholesterol/gamma-HCH transport system permease protein|nr:ABC transporter permease [Paludibacteraceae bacterium]MBR6104028.1 ABC transporter permease [Paludibacteraceae bacterium]
MNIIEHVGSFTKLMKLTLTIPDRWSMFGRQYVREIMKLGIDSIFIDIIISLFIGMAITIQMKLNMSNPILPGYLTGLAVRDTLLLEFSPTILCLILAGKVGSNIASEIGTMRITEQIDAIDIMGINSANYLILPKITAFISVIPSLVIISIFAGILGGLGVAEFTDTITVTEYTQGIQYSFVPFYVTYAIIKSMVFAFIISSVASYYGYTVKGGALEVGKNSTKAVVNSSIIILGSNFMLTKLLLT